MSEIFKSRHWCHGDCFGWMGASVLRVVCVELVKWGRLCSHYHFSVQLSGFASDARCPLSAAKTAHSFTVQLSCSVQTDSTGSWNSGVACRCDCSSQLLVQRERPTSIDYESGFLMQSWIHLCKVVTFLDQWCWVIFILRWEYGRLSIPATTDALTETIET